MAASEVWSSVLRIGQAIWPVSSRQTAAGGQGSERPMVAHDQGVGGISSDCGLRKWQAWTTGTVRLNTKGVLPAFQNSLVGFEAQMEDVTLSTVNRPVSLIRELVKSHKSELSPNSFTLWADSRAKTL
ncbi:uncharacterized protein CIMG_08844 [Coccidioides immitis RS]|uniref:Uncharacterized protein n=4 Tax=Coccidioides immitis TaxID=5501 RepID=J3K6B7_COCIM|nr:uncharacterized protein CIMG_08844 [Coccidioides immitis RS]EAS30098.3 hypothetical protein CIMG_08844 [Coccidioides immitis RS]KMP07046.1 hypothetical protein CIRG_06727 [Coccidioides immitis RMSCC 2394]KMU78985.1 hypothetical protein CISG_07628 [Coccidioides immitis RMSCC 3703]KMU86771.1 hypothetical protein CIHG_04560 [Coccidioides immitis H538.4]